MKVAFKPVNFFTKNPSIDVPPSRQADNQSKLVTPTDVSSCCNDSVPKL